MDMMLSIFGALVLWSMWPALAAIAIFVLAALAYFILLGYDKLANKVIKLHKRFFPKEIKK